MRLIFLRQKKLETEVSEKILCAMKNEQWAVINQHFVQKIIRRKRDNPPQIFTHRVKDLTAAVSKIEKNFPTKAVEVMSENETEFIEDVEIYLEEVRRIPLLSAQEFHTLLMRAAEGDEDAQLELVNANLRLVVNIARNYINQGAAFSDLIQEGNIGLMKAVRKFATKGSATFTEYAEECIEKAIVRGLREMNQSEVSLDTPVDERTYNAQEKFADEGDFVEGMTLADFVEDSKIPDHFDRVNRLQMAELLREVLKTLTPHEKKVLSLRFGLEDGRSRSLDEIAKIFRVSNFAVQNVESKALGKLRNPVHSAKLRDFY